MDNQAIVHYEHDNNNRQENTAPESHEQMAKAFDNIIKLLQPIDFERLTNRRRFEEFLLFWRDHIRKKVENPDYVPVYEQDDLMGDNSGPQAALSTDGEVEKTKVKKEQYKVIAVELLKIAAREAGTPISSQAGEPHLFIWTHWTKVTREAFGHFLKCAMIALDVDRIMAPDADFINKVRKQVEETTGVELKGVSRNMINFQNGTLDIMPDGEVNFQRHSPADLLRYVLPYEYNPNAECPRFQQFLDEVIPEEEKQKNLAEFFGSCFSDVKHEKVMLLYGTGANGKSVILEIVTRLFGKDNIAHNTLEEITNSLGYFRGSLMDCILNYSGEISNKVNPDALKKLASREPMNARYVWGRPFVVKDYCRTAFNCNHFPEVSDNSEGYFRRYLIVHFALTIPKDRQNPRLPEEIAETDLPGIMNWVIAGLQRLLEQGGKFTYSKSSEELLEEYRRFSNSVELFVVQLKSGDQRSFKGTEIYALYRDFCATNELSRVSQKQFSTDLQRHGIRKVRRSDGVYYEID